MNENPTEATTAPADEAETQTPVYYLTPKLLRTQRCGILRVDGDLCEVVGDEFFVTYDLFNGRENLFLCPKYVGPDAPKTRQYQRYNAKRPHVHTSLEAARQRVREMAARRIRYLKGEITRLERIAAGETEVPVVDMDVYEPPDVGYGY